MRLSGVDETTVYWASEVVRRGWILGILKVEEAGFVDRLHVAYERDKSSMTPRFSI